MTETSTSSVASAQTAVLARTLISGIRTRSLYPAFHPNVESAVLRLHEAVLQIGETGGFTLGVTPDTLLLDGRPLQAGDVHVTDAAELLHELDIVRLTFSSQIKTHTLHALLGVLAQDVASLRARGGPARTWDEDGDGAVLIEQIDYDRVLRDRESDRPQAAKDELWLHLARSVSRRDVTFSESEQKRLLEIARDSAAISELTAELVKPCCTPDGSPLITTQATAVLAAYTHLHGIVSVMAPEQVSKVAENIAMSTSDLDPRVVVEIMRGDPGEEMRSALAQGMAQAFDDTQVAQLLATTLALDGKASDRLAEVFDTIVPDDERKNRVLALTKSLLNEGDFGGKDRFQTVWNSVDSLLVSHDESPFVSVDYRASLDTAATRGEAMADGGSLPAELGDWLTSVERENVQSLSVTLLSDLLRIETENARAAEIVVDIQAMTEDLLLTGEYEEALRLVRALAEAATTVSGAGRAASRRALDELGTGTALRETIGVLDALEESEFAKLRLLFVDLGAAAVDSLHATMMFEKKTRTRVRGAELIVAYGAPAVGRLAPLMSHAQWFVRRNAAELVGRIGAAEGVPLLQPLLRGQDSRVLREAVVALAKIDDPTAARAIHTALRASSGEDRQAVIDALIQARDSRVVPVLVRILKESRALGRDHTLVLETLAALAELRDEVAVPSVATVMRQWRWFRRRRNRALKTTAVSTLLKIGSPSAVEALNGAAETGDRSLRRIVSEARGA